MKWRLDMKAGLSYNCAVCKELNPKKSVLHAYGRSIKICDKCFCQWQILAQDNGKFNILNIPRAVLSESKVA